MAGAQIRRPMRDLLPFYIPLLECLSVVGLDVSALPAVLQL